MMSSVLFVITSLDRGGAETQLVRVATALARRGRRVRVLTLIDANRFREQLDEAGVPVDTLGLAAGELRPRALGRAAALVRRAAPDVVCCFLFHATVVGLLAAPFAGRPRVISSMRDPNYGSARRLRLVAWACRLGMIDGVVVNSERNAIALRARRDVPTARVHVVPNAIVASDFLRPDARGRTRAAIGMGPDEISWLAVGNLLAEKDYPTLVRAFAQVVAEEPRARLYIAGRGEPDAALRAPSYVRFLGPRGDVPELLAACDAFVLSSCSEGMPNAVMEAAAAERPIVSTDVGGVREIVSPDESALLVPPRDPVALAGAMVQLMRAPPARRAQLAANARAGVVARFDLDAVADRWEAVLRP